MARDVSLTAATKTAESLPLVSVIMPVHNERAYIERSLGAVLAQDYPADRLEILVVDGMSTDGTRDYVREQATGPTPVQLIDNPRRIVPTGMNLALANASGDIIVRVDGHCVIAPDYVSRCVDHLQSDDVAGVGGAIDTVGETTLAHAIAIAMSSIFGVGGSAFRTLRNRSLLADTVPFPAYLRSAIDRAGPYDEELVRNQDDEYNYRLREGGERLLLAADVRSLYFSRSSWLSLWRQYFQYGYWKVRVMQKHRRQMSLRQFVPPVFVGLLLILAFGACFSTMAAWGLAGILSLYGCTNIAASLAAASRSQWRFAWVLPLTFAILHCSYGLGFLYGLLRFWSRWGDRTTVVRTVVSMPPGVSEPRHLEQSK